MPRLSREDLAAALAARRELGPDYDDAFLDSVVDRLQETMPARAGAPAPKRPAPAARPQGGRDLSLVMALASLLAAIPLSAIAAVQVGGFGLVVAWAAIVAVNVAYMYRPAR
ncbi:hypothetical protein ACRB68_65740 [Actinomadura sp. RB68]|uniref:Uncharacterized protein n=2 Tax=Actinomadura macrotermitis TaxID=2585200 RepID=A0A7K0C4V4_9ACTN|nr:hypothetical protein [Actinomadura macrotermitis]